MGSKPANSETFDKLKDLLIGSEKEQIQKIEDRLNDPMIRAKEISQSLPDAISLSMVESHKISRVLQPVIDESIRLSVKNNPKVLADAISPALGPGIRKSIYSTTMGMIQSLNQIINHSFSIQGIKWRFEAFRTGKQFAEIVLFHTLVYQVEQIFLIHSDSGIVLQHVVAKDSIIQDPDLVSGMLTAIQDFVKDSFNTDFGDDLETLRMGSNRSVWIENGEQALIAAVIRGTPPFDLRIRYQELLEKIHIKSCSALGEFDGDPLPFAIFKEDLQEELKSQDREKPTKISPLLVCILIAILSLSGIWAFTAFKTSQIWNQYLNQLKAQKGVIILSAEKQEGKYQIYGLCDPAVQDHNDLLQQQVKNRITIIHHWENYYSLDPQFVLNRAVKILKPPLTIKLELSGDIVSARGKASTAWIDTFRTVASAIPGINGFNDDLVQNIDKEQQDAERAKLNTALQELMSLKIYFQNNSTKFIQGQEKVLEQVFTTIQNIQMLQHKSKAFVQIVILGHTDSSGSKNINMKLSRSRAENFLNYLIVKGINPAFFTISGVGNKKPLSREANIADESYNRAITFKTFLTYQ